MLYSTSTAGNRPVGIIPKPTRIVSGDQEKALVTQRDVKFLGLAIVHRRVDRI
jgi:hypothetical protein